MDKRFIQVVRDEGAFAVIKAYLENGETIYATLDKFGHIIEGNDNGSWAVGNRFVSNVKFKVNNCIDITETYWNFECGNRFFKGIDGKRKEIDSFKEAIANKYGDLELYFEIVEHHSAEIDGIRYYPITKDWYKVSIFEILDIE